MIINDARDTLRYYDEEIGKYLSKSATEGLSQTEKDEVWRLFAKRQKLINEGNL